MRVMPIIIGIIVLSLFEMRIISFIHNQSLPKLALISDSVLQGKVYNCAFQNRLIGPLAVRAIQTFLGLSVPKSYFIFILLMLPVTNIILFMLFYRLSRDENVSLRYLLYLILSFILLQDNDYFYSWDVVGLLLFSLFAFGIFMRRSTSFFIFLFTVAIFNKEDALFIPLWLIIDAFALEGKKRFKSYVQDYQKLGIGMILILAGAGFIKYIRAKLWVFRPEFAGFGNQFELFISLKRLFYENFFNLKIIITLFVISVAYFFFMNRKRMSFYTIKIVVLFFCMYVATITFGVIHETRIWFNIIPFMLMFHMHFQRLMKEPGGDYV